MTNITIKEWLRSGGNKHGHEKIVIDCIAVSTPEYLSRFRSGFTFKSSGQLKTISMQICLI